MTARTARDTSGDPFGVSVAERLWRRLAGVGAVVVATGAGFGIWISDLLFAVLIGAGVIYVLGVPASWLVSRRTGAPVARHALAGLVVGGLATALFLLLDGSTMLWPAVAVVAIGIGVPAAAAAAWCGLALPDRWVKPLAVIGLLCSAVMMLVIWWERQPPAPYDYVVIHEPTEVQHWVEDPDALARDIADRFEQRAAENHPRTAHTTWADIGRELTDGVLANVPAGLRFTPDDELPVARSTGEPVRLVTTIFDDHPDRGCVVVTQAASRAEPHACVDLDLIR